MKQRFDGGEQRVTAAAVTHLKKSGVSPDTLFARHTAGDWGDANDYLRGENQKAVTDTLSAHAIQSRYRIASTEIICVTAIDRMYSVLQLADEYGMPEKSVRDGYAQWARHYDFLMW
jgi:hypothetical protein